MQETISQFKHGILPFPANHDIDRIHVPQSIIGGKCCVGAAKQDRDLSIVMFDFSGELKGFEPRVRCSAQTNDSGFCRLKDLIDPGMRDLHIDEVSRKSFRLKEGCYPRKSKGRHAPKRSVCFRSMEKKDLAHGRIRTGLTWRIMCKH